MYNPLFPEIEQDLQFMPYWYQFNLNGSQSFQNDMWVPNPSSSLSPPLFPPFSDPLPSQFPTQPFQNPFQNPSQIPTQPMPQPQPLSIPQSAPQLPPQPQSPPSPQSEEYRATPVRKRRQSQPSKKKTKPKKSTKSTKKNRASKRRLSAPQSTKPTRVAPLNAITVSTQLQSTAVDSKPRRVSSGNNARPMPTYMNNSLLQSLHRIHVESTNPANQHIRPQHQKKLKSGLIKKNAKQSKKKIKTLKNKKKLKSANKDSRNGSAEKDSIQSKLAVSPALMEFFCNSAIRKNRLRVEKKTRENAAIESAMTTKERYEAHLREMREKYGDEKAQKIGQCEMAMDADFSKALDNINSNQPTHKQVAFWPEAPLQF